MKILFTGGGTGGHIFPIIAIVREMRRVLPDPKNWRFTTLARKTNFLRFYFLRRKLRLKEF